MSLAGVGLAAAQATSSASEQLAFARDWPEQPVPFYRIVVHADGTGSFTTERTAAPAEGVAAAAGGAVIPQAAPATDGVETAQAEAVAAPIVTAGAHGRSAIHVSEKTTARLFATAGVLRSGKECQSGNRHLAQTGKKVLTLTDGAGEKTCSFNYSDDKRIEDAVTAFGAIATTLEERPTLEHLRRFDRLGLDAELGSFLESARSGRAIELANIAPLLEQLATDDALMDRVRSRAATLLTMAQAGS